MKDKLIVIFNMPLALPSNENKMIATYGLCLDNTVNAFYYNIREYVINYISVIAQLYKDKGVKACSDWIYEKDGQEIVVYDPIWERYAEKARKTGLQFAFIDDGNADIKEDDLYEIFLTSEEKWTELKGMKKSPWYPKVDVRNDHIGQRQ